MPNGLGSSPQALFWAIPGTASGAPQGSGAAGLGAVLSLRASES